jgi:hypothetical protein
MPCMCRYYFYDEGGDIETVLKDANLVDIIAVKAQISESKTSVVAGLTGTFTWRWGRTNAYANFDTEMAHQHACVCPATLTPEAAHCVTVSCLHGTLLLQTTVRGIPSCGHVWFVAGTTQMQSETPSS